MVSCGDINTLFHLSRRYGLDLAQLSCSDGPIATSRTALLGGPRSRMAIIDAVSIVHTRPMGTRYNVAEAHAEERALLDCYQWSH